MGLGMALAHAGADVALAARTVAQLEKAAELLRATGRRALILPTAVSDIAAVSKIIC